MKLTPGSQQPRHQDVADVTPPGTTGPRPTEGLAPAALTTTTSPNVTPRHDPLSLREPPTRGPLHTPAIAAETSHQAERPSREESPRIAPEDPAPLVSHQTQESMQRVLDAMTEGRVTSVDAATSIGRLLASEATRGQPQGPTVAPSAAAYPSEAQVVELITTLLDRSGPDAAEPLPHAADIAHHAVRQFLLDEPSPRGDEHQPPATRASSPEPSLHGIEAESQAITTRAQELLASSSPPGGPAPTVEKKAHALSLALLEKLVQGLSDNNFTNPIKTVAATGLNALGRNGLSVFAPAIVRGLISYGVQAGADRTHASDKSRDAVAASIMLLPVALLAAGAARDVAAGTANRASLLGQVIMATQTVAAAAAGLKTGTIGKVLGPVVAFTAFGALRTVGVQSRLTLPDRGAAADKKPDVIDYAAASVIYGLTVFASTLAYASKPLRTGAAAFRAGDGVGAAAKGSTLAGLNNLMQETVDTLAFSGVPAAREGRALPLQLKDQGYTRTSVVNQAVGAFPMLTVYNTACIVAGAVASQHFPDDPKQSALLLATLYAVYSGVFYTPFVVGLSGQPAVKAPEARGTAATGHELSRLDVEPTVDVERQGPR